VERGRCWACSSRRPGPGRAFWYLQRRLSSGPIRMGFCRGHRVGPLKRPCRPTQNRSSSPVRPRPLCVGNTGSSPWSNIAAFSDQTTILAPSSSACRVRLRKLSFRRHFLDWMGRRSGKNSGKQSGRPAYDRHAGGDVRATRSSCSRWLGRSHSVDFGRESRTFWAEELETEGGSVPPASTKLPCDLRSSTPKTARRSF
jgi:hypothetical protein